MCSISPNNQPRQINNIDYQINDLVRRIIEPSLRRYCKDVKKVRSPKPQHVSRRILNKQIMDGYGKNPWLTACNTISAACFLIGGLIPFVIIGLTIFYFHDNRIVDFTVFFSKFVCGWALFFLIVIPVLTLMTNHRIKKIYHRRATYNLQRIYRRKKWLSNYYRHKFGDHLHSQKIYRVAKGNNIPIDYIIKHYQKDNKRTSS